MSRPLLPSGCHDLLPPSAACLRESASALMHLFARYGYEEASPSLLEYTDTLLAGRGAELAPATFRVMDPDARRVMGIRPDITLQIARLAGTRLRDAPRPLRLAYAGQILRVQDDAFHARRQFMQAGIEMVGAHHARADAEVIFIGCEALNALGIKNIHVDLALPGLTDALLEPLNITRNERENLLEAVQKKDYGALQRANAGVLAELATCFGPAAEVLARMRQLALPEGVIPQLEYAGRVIGWLGKRTGGNATLTLDPLDGGGGNYHSGLSFSFFCPETRRSLGKGGRYRMQSESEDAVGFSLFLDDIALNATAKSSGRRVYVGHETDKSELESLHAEGYTTVFAESDEAAEMVAERMGCTHIYREGKVYALEENS